MFQAIKDLFMWMRGYTRTYSHVAKKQIYVRKATYKIPLETVKRPTNVERRTWWESSKSVQERCDKDVACQCRGGR